MENGYDPDAGDKDFQAPVSEEENDTGTDDENISAHELGNASSARTRKTSPKPRQPTVRARPFKRVTVPEGPAPNFGNDGASDYPVPGIMPPPHHCRACGEFHALGWCRLKIANVEYCGLCGMAHIGAGRTCPHFNDETQVATMLNTLKESTESRDLVEQAVKYLRQVRGDLAWRKRNQERKNQERENLERDNQHSAGTFPRTYGYTVHAQSNGYSGFT